MTRRTNGQSDGPRAAAKRAAPRRASKPRKAAPRPAPAGGGSNSVVVASAVSFAVGAVLVGAFLAPASSWEALRGRLGGLGPAPAAAGAPAALTSKPAADKGRQPPTSGARPAAEGAPAPAAAAPAAAAPRRDDDPIVYVSLTGSTYHSGGCRELGAERLSLPLSDARASYAPCAVCRPPS